VINSLELLTVRNKTTIVRGEGWRSTDTPTTIWELIPVLGSLAIALWLDGPEDWSDILRLSLRRLEEWKRLGLVHDAQSLDDLDDCCLKVHGVEMQKSASTFHELLALLNSEVHTKVSYLFVITLEWLKCITQTWWHIGLAEANRSMESIIT